MSFCKVHILFRNKRKKIFPKLIQRSFHAMSMSELVKQLPTYSYIKIICFEILSISCVFQSVYKELRVYVSPHDFHGYFRRRLYFIVNNLITNGTSKNQDSKLNRIILNLILSESIGFTLENIQ